MRRKSGTVDLRDAGLKISTILGTFFLKSEHMHYGFWDDSLVVNLENLPAAQELYTAFLLKHIPSDVNSILDVGCGVGSNASVMLQKGYTVDCVSPSDYLTQKTREKVDDRAHIYPCFFEEIETDKTYDLILFSESFSYVKIDKALDQCMKLLKPGGYLLICDFFRLPAERRSPISGGHKIGKFFSFMENYPLVLREDIDITANTAPNHDLVNGIIEDVIIPIRETVKEVMVSNYRKTSKMIAWIARCFFKKRLKKMHYKYFSGQRNAETFSHFKSYRLLLYQREVASTTQD